MNNFQPQVHDYAMEGTAIVSGSDIYDHENDDSDSSSFSSTEGNNYANNNNNNDNDNNMNNNLDNLAQIKEHAMSEDDANDNDNDNNSHYDEEDEDMNEDGAQNTRKYNIPKIDPLYNPNGDDEDEAYVYKNLRGGLEEKVSIRATNRDQNDNTKNTNSNSTNTSTNSNDNTNSNTKTSAQTQAQAQAQAQSQSQQQKQQQQAFSLEQAKILKPRNSDGVLSCPCCFQIVCMDCQKHDKYLNQYRAMFVMNIGVDWNVTVTPEHVGKREKEEQVEYGEGQSSSKRIKGNSSNGYNIDLNINRTNSDTNSGANNNVLKPIQVPTDEEHRIHENNLKNDKAEVYYSVYCTGCRTQVAALDMTDEIYYFFGCIVSG